MRRGDAFWVLLVLIAGAAWGLIHSEGTIVSPDKAASLQDLGDPDGLRVDSYDDAVEACREFTDAIETQLCEHDNTPYKRILREEQRYGPYVARVYTSLRSLRREHPDSRLEISRGGRVVYTFEEFRLSLNDGGVAMGTSVSGRGIPELAVAVNKCTWGRTSILLELANTVRGK